MGETPAKLAWSGQCVPGMIWLYVKFQGIRASGFGVAILPSLGFFWDSRLLGHATLGALGLRQIVKLGFRVCLNPKSNHHT